MLANFSWREFRDKSWRLALAVYERGYAAVAVNRRIAAGEGDTLLVGGAPASLTVLDGVRLARNRAALARAEQALHAAQSEMARPYALFPEAFRLIEAKLTRALALALWIACAAGGVGAGAFGGWWLTQPDTVLLHQAMRDDPALRRLLSPADISRRPPSAPAKPGSTSELAAAEQPSACAPPKPGEEPKPCMPALSQLELSAMAEQRHSFAVAIAGGVLMLLFGLAGTIRWQKSPGAADMGGRTT